MTTQRSPKRIDIRRADRTLLLDWGAEGAWRIPLSVVRRLCPCAVCTDHRGEPDDLEAELHMLEGMEATATDDPETVRPVGRYAIQIRWADGHDTGIYTFDYLRRMCDLEGRAEAV